ncbi:MAG: hypothetical protein J2P57_13665 [Acidimicrobiaceae bacterium]|nr:hypothetical protein [Acidimicrobiaceae bacterium]
MRFETPLTITGPLRTPAQLLADQDQNGRKSVHDAARAAEMGLPGAPIEGPTHFSQFDPLAVTLWGSEWWERGCLSCHFRTMVIEGEQVQASLTTTGPSIATVEAHKADGTPVLVGSAGLGGGPSALEERMEAMGDPGELFIVDQMHIGMRIDSGTSSIPAEERNGPLYPFSLAEKLAVITEPHPWYTAAGATSSPWGRPIVPLEMLSVLTNKVGQRWPVRQPSTGLFLDLEVRMLDGPVFVDQEYRLEAEVVGLSQSRRTESYWVRTTIREGDRAVAAVLLHSGVFKQSYPEYPAELLV